METPACSRLEGDGCNRNELLSGCQRVRGFPKGWDVLTCGGFTQQT